MDKVDWGFVALVAMAAILLIMVCVALVVELWTDQAADREMYRVCLESGGSVIHNDDGWMECHR